MGGQIFEGAVEFSKCLKNYYVATRRSFVYVKNDSEKVIVICNERSCEWRIYDLKHKTDNLFGIRKCILKHICGENNPRSRGHPRADVYWIANVVKEKLRGEPSYRPCTMQQDLQREFVVELEYCKVWKGKELAMHDIHGTYERCYDRLRWYFNAIKKTNPGSVVDCEIDPLTKKFRRVLIFHQYIPFDEFTIFSDRHHSIIKAVNHLFPESGHAYCLRHLVDNFVKQVLRSYPRHNKKYWSSVFKKAVYAPSFQEYEQHINSIFESMPLARGFILNSDPQSWENALFVGNRWGVINNNIAEYWNSWVRPARHLPTVGMVDHIRVQIMSMMQRWRESTLSMSRELSPRKGKSVASVYIESRTLRVHRSCNWKFEVIDGEKSFAMDLADRTCSCRAWKINKLLCKHACSAIESKSLSLYDFCDKYFKIEMYCAAYKGIINPIPTFDMSEACVDESDIIQAPCEKAIIGRGFEHGITLETTYTFERKHCWIALGLRHLWN
ncbi:uncharacterized protein [Henckelia pumila]|uniref:uncharacterized protein n=1 Tax=Henckelia pumila TaxID=405737 RepID=UPI003C6E43EA